METKVSKHLWQQRWRLSTRRSRRRRQLESFWMRLIAWLNMMATTMIVQQQQCDSILRSKVVTEPNVVDNKKGGHHVVTLSKHPKSQDKQAS
ncbi:hypothetical protein V6N13_020133 [Hibiscus sabdariffa]